MFKRKKRRNPVKRYIDDIEIYEKKDRETGELVPVAYFDVWCTHQIGAPWNDQFNFMLDTMRMGLEEIESYWIGLRSEFYNWCRENQIKGWGVHLYDDGERRRYEWTR